jgi:hypothetical protein
MYQVVNISDFLLLVNRLSVHLLRLAHSLDYVLATGARLPLRKGPSPILLLLANLHSTRGASLVFE